jgi:hypothetical protein
MMTMATKLQIEPHPSEEFRSFAAWPGIDSSGAP